MQPKSSIWAISEIWLFGESGTIIVNYLVLILATTDYETLFVFIGKACWGSLQARTSNEWFPNLLIILALLYTVVDLSNYFSSVIHCCRFV